MIIEKLRAGYWDGKGTPEENVIFFEQMTQDEMFKEYSKTMKALSTESMFVTRDARGYANILIDCWNQVHNLHGWYDIFEDGGEYNTYPIRYVNKEKLDDTRGELIKAGIIPANN